MSRFQGVSLPSGLSDKKIETEVRKMGLDLLQKMNTVSSEIGISNSGSNANGAFFQSSDGYMICNIRLNLGTASQAWTFPKRFVNTPTVVGMMVSGSNARIITLDNVSPTSCTVLGWTDSGAASSDARNVVAYGFWK